ncbi:MAG: Rieske 2Fe-2S domain-containing protein [Chloroflexi bacterium]|nr:Rieske 2Fe-2S domain-containing protein [Chloroflexota bacterium]
MLSKAENELMCKVGAGTPTGDLIRHYWIPALMSSELPERDGQPLRVRLLGEDLVAYRDTLGRIGMVDDRCPHRGAGMFFGRNEEDGLRCVYHGWKFDITGSCVDMPNAPEGAEFKNKVEIKAYPCIERNGVIWTYMGPKEVPPPLPDLEFNMVPVENRHIAKRLQINNFVQGLEGDIDNSHNSYLHTKAPFSSSQPSDKTMGPYYKELDRVPVFEAVDTDYGVLIGCHRNVDEDNYYWRMSQYLLPFYTMTGPYGEDPLRGFRAWIPIDDEHTMVFGATYHPNRPLTEEELAKLDKGGGVYNVGEGGFLPEDPTLPGSQWRPRQNITNDFWNDYHAQQTERWSGIPGTWAQDSGMQETMGPIYDRSKEHLVSTDSGIIHTRYRLINAARAFRENGELPAGVDDPSVFAIRSAATVLAKDENWIEATDEQRIALQPVNHAGA